MNYMSSIQNQRILACYEYNCSGETIATRAICAQLSKIPFLKIKSKELGPLKYTDSLRFFTWIFHSIFYWLLVILRNKKIDWIYTTTFTAGVAAVLLKPFFHYKICWHFHGTRIPPKDEKRKNITFITQNLKHYFVFSLHTFFISQTDLIFVPCNFSFLFLQAQFDEKLTEKIVIIPNGVNLNFFHSLSSAKKSQIKRTKGFPAGQKILSYVGRIEKRKNIEGLLDVFSLLNKKDKNIFLCICYPTPANSSEENYLTLMKEKVVSLKLNSYVKWIKDSNSLNLIYNMSDLVLSFSEEEQFPLTLLEAWACQVFYASRPVGVIPELIRPVNPELVLTEESSEKTAKQILNFLSLPLKRKRTLMKEIYNVVSGYSWERTTKLIFAKLAPTI
jgi:glycosyltransferase involved in cell wall biosynthesis